MPTRQGSGDITVFAETSFRNARRRFGIKTDDRRRHMYLIGKTGMGKSTTIENMVVADIRAGRGVGLVDPHGDLAEKILDYIPDERVNDVVYFNPADVDFPIAFNILETVDETHKHLVASGMMGVFKKLWPDVWSARMEYILNNTVLALLEYPNATMLGINRMLADREFRKKVVAKIKDPVVKMFWVDEFARYHDRFATEAIAPIQNKVGQFLSASIIRNIVGQVKSTIALRTIMDEGKILIVNLAKGKIGEDNSKLLGGLIITRLQIAAMERVDIPEEQRQDFYLYVDEFQNFATESFAHILSEARKYRLNLIFAHQYIGQLIDEKSTRVRDAVFGNVGTMLVFRVGGQDAEFLLTEFEPEYTEQDLVNLTKFNVCIKLMIDGLASTPFSAATLPPLAESLRTANREKVIRVTRERYGVPRAVIEEKIARWTGVMSERSGEARQEAERGETAHVRHPGVRFPPPVFVPPGTTAAVSGQPERREEQEVLGSREAPSPAAVIEPKVIVSEEPPISLREALARRPLPFRESPVQREERRSSIPDRRVGLSHRRIGGEKPAQDGVPPARPVAPTLKETTRPLTRPPSSHPRPLRRGEVVKVRPPTPSS